MNCATVPTVPLCQSANNTRTLGTVAQWIQWHSRSDIVDYRETFKDKNGVIWAITDYGLLRLNPRQRQRRRAAQRRGTLMLIGVAGFALFAMAMALMWR